jgi:hypothetical protein
MLYIKLYNYTKSRYLVDWSDLLLDVVPLETIWAQYESTENLKVKCHSKIEEYTL